MLVPARNLPFLRLNRAHSLSPYWFFFLSKLPTLHLDRDLHRHCFPVLSQPHVSENFVIVWKLAERNRNSRDQDYEEPTTNLKMAVVLVKVDRSVRKWYSRKISSWTRQKLSIASPWKVTIQKGRKNWKQERKR